jgi:hypothetical protein
MGIKAGQDELERPQVCSRLWKSSSHIAMAPSVAQLVPVTTQTVQKVITKVDVRFTFPLRRCD